MTYFIAIALIMSLSGCGHWSRVTAQITGYSEVCVQGVKYVQFSSGVSVLYDQTGKPLLCVE